MTFPGSNCDRDCYHVIAEVLRQEVRFIWHQDTSLADIDCVILPGGFSYGDYLRTGSIARFSPIMTAVTAFAESGGIVLGICNGFQILLEIGLLPGAMLRNSRLAFICEDVHIKVEQADTAFTNQCEPGQILTIPIAHAEGNYYADSSTLETLEAHGQIMFRYCDHEGNISREANPNGSTGNIAGIRNRRGNILGMMPHPERCAEDLFGNTDGLKIFSSLLSTMKQTVT